MNFKEQLKIHWKTIVIVLLAVMFLSKCTSSGNYKRKYNKQLKQTEYVVDSMNTVYANSSKYIDSLKNIIVLQNNEIKSLNEQLDIYKEQNTQLNDRNKALANKQIIVNVEKENK